MDNPAQVIRNARENIKKAASVRAMFGSYEAALEDVEAERVIRSSQKFINIISGAGLRQRKKPEALAAAA